MGLQSGNVNNLENDLKPADWGPSSLSIFCGLESGESSKTASFIGNVAGNQARW